MLLLCSAMLDMADCECKGSAVLSAPFQRFEGELCCDQGGSVIVLPGVTIGKGSTVGAGSVVTKVPPAMRCRVSK